MVVAACGCGVFRHTCAAVFCRCDDGCRVLMCCVVAHVREGGAWIQGGASGLQSRGGGRGCKWGDVERMERHGVRGLGLGGVRGGVREGWGASQGCTLKVPGWRR